MNLNLTNRRAVVCGSTRGIGRACAFELAMAGADITLLARSEAALSDVATSLPADDGQSHDYTVADFSDSEMVTEAIERVLEKHPAVHILVNNTGGPPGGKAVDADADAYRAAFDAHLVCSHALVQAILPGMKDAGFGRIINIISTSVKEPIAGLGVSNVVRSAVAAWAKTLSSELGPLGVTVNNVLPGFTATDRLSSLISSRAKSSGASEEEIAESMRKQTPAGRFAQPEEIAAAVAFLASPAASYISGVSLAVDGGRTRSI